MKKALEIFKAGKHTALGGQVLEFGAADLRATVDAYDPALHEAPMVVGHPGIDAPAYGWVKRLAIAGSKINAEPDQVDAAFAEMVNSGRFKKISPSFYLPNAPNNPVPGVYYLRHVGFLGAAPPAVKGLKSASFAADKEGVVEFGDWSDRVEAGLFRKLREWIIGKFGQDEADKALPGWDVDMVQNEAAQPEQAEESGLEPSFVENQHHQEENMTAADIAAREAALQQKEAAFTERETALKQKEVLVVHQDHLVFAEGLIKAGTLLPAHKEKAVAMLDFATGLCTDQVVEFGEGDAKKAVPMGELFKEFLAQQPKIVEFGEVIKPESETTTAEFAAAPGYTVDSGALELHHKALAYQALHPGLDYIAAVKAVN